MRLRPAPGPLPPPRDCGYPGPGDVPPGGPTMTVRVALCVAGLTLSAGGLRAEPPDPQPIADALRPLHAAALRVRLAQIELEQTRERAAWANRMAKKGYMSPAQA